MASKKAAMLGNSSIQDGKPEVRRLSSSVLGFWSGGAPNSDEVEPAATCRKSASKKPITTRTPPTVSTYQSTSNSVRKLATRFERDQPDVSNDITSSSSGSNTSDDSTVDWNRRNGSVARKRSCNRKLFSDAAQSSSTESSSGILETTNDSSWTSSQDNPNSSGVLLHESTGSSDLFSTPENSLTSTLAGSIETPAKEADFADLQRSEESPPDPEADLSIHYREKEKTERLEKIDSNELIEELTPVSFDPGLPSAFSAITTDPTATTTTISPYFPPTNNDTDFTVAADRKPSDATPSRGLSFPAIEDGPPPVPQREDAVEEEKEDFFPPTNDSDILVAHSFSVKEGNEEDTQAHDINKSDYSEGILYNLIHAAQAAVEQESQLPSGSSSSHAMKSLPPLESSLKPSHDASSVAMGNPGSVIGESSTMTRGGETVIRSNRSNRAVPQLVPTTSDSQSDRVGQALADALERSFRDNPEYLSESSISGTESVTSGDTSDLENFLGSFMTDFVGTNNRLQCGSKNQVVENKKPTMPSLLEIREYLNKEKSTEEHEEEENRRVDHYYSKRVLGDHLSEATSQVESHLDSATWDTEANDTKATSKSETTHGAYTPTQWFETIQKTILSMTSTKATAETSHQQETKKAPSNFADSFDTLDEIMQALQGSPPLSTRGRQSRDSSLTEQSVQRDTPRLKTPTKKAILKNSNKQQQAKSYSSTPLKPPPGRRPDTDTDSTEKPSDSFLAADNSLLQKSLDRSYTAPLRQPDSPSTGSHAASGTNDSQSTPPSARMQIDEIYSVMQKSRGERATETPPMRVASTEPVDEKQQEVRVPDVEQSADQGTSNAQKQVTPIIRRRSRRLPRINVTKRSEGNAPVDSVLSRRSLEKVDGLANKKTAEKETVEKCLPAVEPLNLPSRSIESVSHSGAKKTGGDLAAEAEEWRGPHWRAGDEMDPNDKSESGLTILGQEWGLHQSDTDLKSTDTADGPSTVSLDAPVLDSSLIHSDRSVPSSEGFHVFVQEQEGEGDLSSILNVNSSMGSESNVPFATPISPQKTERGTAATVNPEKNNPSGKKVLKRLGNMIFTRGLKNTSGMSTSEADTSTESPTNEYLPCSTFDPLTTDGELSRTNDTSSCSSTDPRQKQVGRWRLRLSGKTPDSLLEHEDEMTRASGDTAQPQRQQSAFVDIDWSAIPMEPGNFVRSATRTEPEADQREFIATTPHKLHVNQDDDSATTSLEAFRKQTQGNDESGWEEFPSAVPFKQFQSTRKSSNATVLPAPWESFTPKATDRSPPPKRSHDKTSFAKSPSTNQSSPGNEGWEAFFGSGSFQRGYEI